MTEDPQKAKSFEELKEIYHKYKLLSKIENNVEGTKLESILKYVTDMCEELQDDNTELMQKLQTIKSSLLYDEARVHLNNQKTIIALEKLRKALHVVKPYRANQNSTYLYFRILNQLAYFLAQNNEIDESIGLLEDGEIFYEQLEDKSEISIFDTDDLFKEIRSQTKRSTLKFEKLITNNYHLQGWIYNRKQLTDKFIIYYHVVLRRQLETQDSSALLWIFKCARLASYFFGNHKFSEGRYHLAASYYVLREYELDLLKRRNDTQFVAEWANLQKYYADLGKYWVKYGLFLFDASRRTLQNEISDSSINDILIKSFKDPLPRKSFQCINKHLKEKLQTIDEKPEDVNEITNNSVSPELTNDKISEESEQHPLQQPLQNLLQEPLQNPLQEPLQNSVQEPLQNSVQEPLQDPLPQSPQNPLQEPLQQPDDCKNEPIESDAEDADAKLKEDEKGDSTQRAINKDVAEITNSIMDLLDDRLKEDRLKDEDEDEDGRNCVAKYMSMLDNLNNTPSPQSQTNDEGISDAADNKEEAEVKKSGGCKDKSNYLFVFPSLSLNDIESKVTNESVTTLDSARNLFLYTQEWLKRCKAYYCIQDFPLDYVNLILDLNDLYRYLSLYETNIDLQYDVQKRRVDLLERLTQLLKEYRPQFYLTLNIELVNELTQAQVELILLNLRRLNCTSSPPQQKEEVYRKMEALIDIRKRLSRKESFKNFSASKMVTSLSESEFS